MRERGITMTDESMPAILDGPDLGLRLPSLAAVQLAQVLQDAGAVIGQLRARVAAKQARR